MRLSETRTDHIVFKADAFDEWTMINCAIVNISHIADALINAHGAMSLLKPAGDLWNISFWNSAPDFFFLDPDEQEWVEELDENKIWSFLEITETELEELAAKRDYRTESGLLTIDTDEKLQFRAWIKHTCIEMATATFTLEQLGIETGS